MKGEQLTNPDMFDSESQELLRELGAMAREDIDVSDVSAPEVPESEGKASGGEGGQEQASHEEAGNEAKCTEDKYPHAGGILPKRDDPSFFNAINAYIKEHPDTWPYDLTNEEYTALAEWFKDGIRWGESEGCKELIDTNRADLMKLRQAWRKRNQITSDDQAGGGDELAGTGTPPEPEA